MTFVSGAEAMRAIKKTNPDETYYPSVASDKTVTLIPKSLVLRRLMHHIQDLKFTEHGACSIVSGKLNIPYDAVKEVLDAAPGANP